MPPLALLTAALGWNYARHRHGRSTMCSYTRDRVPVALGVLAWLGLTAWFLPHWMKPNKPPGMKAQN